MTYNPPSIEDTVQDYIKQAYGGQQLPANQEREVKNAFFAGCFAALCAFERCGEPDVDEQDMFLIFRSFKNECINHAKNEARRATELN